MRSTDNVTPEPLLRYEVFANDQFIGLLDRGTDTTVGQSKLIDEGPNQVYVEAVDAAGNRARNGTATVTGFDCELYAAGPRAVGRHAERDPFTRPARRALSG